MSKKKLVEFRYVKDIANDHFYIQRKYSFNRWEYEMANQVADNEGRLTFKNKDKAMAWLLDQYDLKYEAMEIIQHPSLKIV